jgi:mycoredoxin
MTWLVLAVVVVLFVGLPFVLLRAPWMKESSVVGGATGKPAAPPVVESGMADFTMYSTGWCGFCARLRSQLAQAGITYTEIDIEGDPDAASFVESVNNGNQVVPTLRFADGSTATNPSLAQVQAKLAA